MDPPFNILPEEIWEMILDQVEDGEDTQTMFTVFPALGSRLHRRKTDWLIDQVFPFIFNHGQRNPKDILSMRAVSKRWHKVVNNFLEGHPSRRPYNPEGSKRQTVQYGDFSYQALDKFPCLQIIAPIHLRHLLDAFPCFHSNPNPFVGGVIKIENPPGTYGPGNRVHEQILLKWTLDLLRIHGRRILTIELSFGVFEPTGELTAKNIFLMILTCLEHLPNLRSLGISFQIRGFEADDLPDSFPPLPNLESIKFLPRMQSGSPLEFFMMAYMDNYKIKRIQTNLLTHWREEYGEWCKHLTEADVWIGDGCPQMELMGFLMDIRTESLRRLRIGFDLVTIEKMRMIVMIMDNENVELDELEIYSPAEEEDDRPLTGLIKLPDLDPLPSIKYLRFQDCRCCDYEFLKYLPSLQSLALDCKAGPRDKLVEGLKIRYRGRYGVTMATMVRGYMYIEPVPKRLDIWKELSELKLLTVYDNGLTKQFARELGNMCLKF